MLFKPFALILAAVSASGAPPAHSEAGRPIPSLPDVLGVTHVAGTYRLKKGDFLGEGVDQILALGSRVVKLYLARPATDYPHGSEWTRAGSLAEMAQLAPYRTVFSKPVATYILTCYRPGVDHHYWRRGVTDEERHAETREFHDLARHLLATYRGSGKTFVLQHWEGDWAIRGSFDPNGAPTPKAIRGMIDWLNARQRGVDQARSEIRGSDVKVYHALEVNRVVQTLKTKHPGVADQVLPHTTVDLVSYSAWDAQQDPELLKKALDFIEARLPRKDVPLRKRVYIGEFGAPENDFPPDRVRSTVRGVVETGLEWGCPWIVYWQVYCNEARRRPVKENEDVRGFWLLRPDGTKAWAWDFLHGRLVESVPPR